jgi:hypothetical protein
MTHGEIFLVAPSSISWLSFVHDFCSFHRFKLIEGSDLHLTRGFLQFNLNFLESFFAMRQFYRVNARIKRFES